MPFLCSDLLKEALPWLVHLNPITDSSIPFSLFPPLSLPKIPIFYVLCLLYFYPICCLSTSIPRSHGFSSLLFTAESPLPQTVPGPQFFDKWVNTAGSGSRSVVRAQRKEGGLECGLDGTGLWRKRRGGKLLESRACLIVITTHSASDTQPGAQQPLGNTGSGTSNAPLILFYYYSVTVVPIFPFLFSPSTPTPPSHGLSPPCCPCPWVLYTCSLTRPF